MTGFFRGVTAPGRGLMVVLGHRALWPWVVGPALITTMLVSAALFVAFATAVPVASRLFPGAIDVPLLGPLLVGSIAVAGAFAYGVLAWMLSMLLAIPLHDRLSEGVEALHRPLPSPLSFREALPRSIRHSLAAFLLWVSLQGMLLPLHLLPGIGAVLDLVIGGGISAVFVAHQLVDGTLSRRAMSLREKLAWMRAHPGPLLGLGVAGLVILAVPLVNLIGLPVAVAGGTLLVVELGAESPSHRG